MGRAPELVSQLTTKATASLAAIRKLSARIAKEDPDIKTLNHMMDDTISILRNLQLEVNTNNV
jgi:hypothetical protein